MYFGEDVPLTMTFLVVVSNVAGLQPSLKNMFNLMDVCIRAEAT